MRESPLDEERGSTIPFLIAMTLALVLMLALAFDLACQLVVAERANSDLQVCKQELSQTATGFVIKNSSSPLADAAQDCVDSLRAQGFDGDIAVYAYEPAAGYSAQGRTLPANRRIIALKVMLADESPAMFSRLGGTVKLPVYADAEFSVLPYSSGAAWRPTAQAAWGTYICGRGSSTVSLGTVANIASMRSVYSDDEIKADVLEECENSLIKITDADGA